MRKTVVLFSLLIIACPLFAEVSTDLGPDSNIGHVSNSNSRADGQCAAIVQECFGREDSERSNCLYTASTHADCDGTELGKLVHSRWEVSPIKFAGQEEPPALLGPQSVDLECVANFDNRLYGLMTNKKLDKKQISQLSKELEECRRKTPMELPRP